MDNQEIETKVRKIIHEQLDISMDDNKPESELRSFGLDSLDTVELLLALEETFEIDIPDETIGSLITVKDIIDYVEKHPPTE
jgi:acyl carrier protein